MKITEYIKETRGEMKHVNWPTRKQAGAFTALVIGVSIAAALFLGVLDYVFSVGLQNFLK